MDELVWSREDIRIENMTVYRWVSLPYIGYMGYKLWEK